ncbi:MAG: polyprenyl diphosphate synthase [Dehalococcoidia bacterium]|nr:polyprenyl diphosphate synthase [Dehalococcoidia bacterium]MDD5493509.1 polyprenyl diphosphate synthase [Dehalococcoidia bacterium]
MMNFSKGIKLPKHVAIIMDGNGRWAKKRHKPRLFGHRQGALHARDFIEMFSQYNIPYLSLYAFSTENWNRPAAEVQGILSLLEENLEQAVKIAGEKNIRINHLGNADGLPRNIQLKAENALEATKNNTGLTVNIAFNYGGRSEIVAATRRIIEDRLSPADVDENLFSRYLYTSGIPDPDLFIRTGEEMRLSNFLIWQAAYAELYFSPILWPDFGKHDFEKALKIYSKRQRRFGGLESY